MKLRRPKMYAKTYTKMDILISDELNQCMACDYTSYEYGEVYDKKGDEITSWNTEDHVVCPSCKSFDYYILKENEDAS
jgi:hypothetical protein